MINPNGHIYKLLVSVWPVLRKIVSWFHTSLFYWWNVCIHEIITVICVRLGRFHFMEGSLCSAYGNVVEKYLFLHYILYLWCIKCIGIDYMGQYIPRHVVIKYCVKLCQEITVSHGISPIISWINIYFFDKKKLVWNQETILCCTTGHTPDIKCFSLIGLGCIIQNVESSLR